MRPSRFALLPLLILAVSLPVQADKLTTTPEPGLWISESTTLVNGVDMQERLQEMRAAMLSQIPEAQREMMREMLGDTGQVGERQCITAALARSMTDPQTLLKDAEEQMPECQLTASKVSANSLEFTGQCNDPEGFSGQLSGSLEIRSSKETRSTFNGDGHYMFPAGLIEPDAEAGNNPVKLMHSQVSRWVSSDCDDTSDL